LKRNDWMSPLPRIMTACALFLLGAGCSGNSGPLDARVWPSHDTRIEGPVPWFLDGGCRDGACTDGVPSRDLRVDQRPPDLCIPPKSCDVTFSLAKGSESASEVAGNFYGTTWTRLPMTLSGSTWQKAVTLTQGQQVLYKFVLDGSKWIPDPTNPKQVDDGYGGKNSVLDVNCPNPCP
jgi:hypothetical protein